MISLGIFNNYFYFIFNLNPIFLFLPNKDLFFKHKTTLTIRGKITNYFFI